MSGKVDEKIDKNFEVVPIRRSLSEQKFYLKVLVILLFVFNLIVIITKLFL